MQAFKRTLSQRGSAPSSPALSASSSNSNFNADSHRRSVTPDEISEQLSQAHSKVPNSRRSLDKALGGSLAETQKPQQPLSPLAFDAQNATSFSQPQDPGEAGDIAPTTPLTAQSNTSGSYKEARSSTSTPPDYTAASGVATSEPATSSHKSRQVVPSIFHLTAADVQTSEQVLLEDLQEVARVLDLFLNSRISEAQQLCFEPARQGSLYMSHGYSCISTIKALLTFEHQDLAYAIECCQSTMHLCNLLRKPGGVTSTLGNWVRGISAEDQLKSMSIVQRHAELVNAECMILKAFAAIMRSGDFFTFIREALALRSAHSSYRSLGRYLQAAEAAGQPVDSDFASGVHLGLGAVSLVLSLLPERAVSVMSYFGFEGDRQTAIDLLKAPGGWSHNEPITRSKQGLRRPLADMVLLAYLLYIASLVPVGPIDTALASRVLAFSRNIYPNGAFLWLFYGRLKTLEAESDEAVDYYWRSINSQHEAVQLHHMCYWDLSIVHLATGDLLRAEENLEKIYKSSNWSKAVYSYGVAVAAYGQACDNGDEELQQKATTYMQQVPASKQKIAGKSIPLEKYVARRAQRYTQQGNTLLLAALEFTFMLNALQYASPSILRKVHLESIQSALQSVEAVPEEQRAAWNGNGTWWDDYCLCKLLSGACHRLLAHPPEHIKAEREPSLVERESSQARRDLQEVLKNGRRIKLEHQLVWFGHYEMAALCEAMGELDEATEHYKRILNGPKSMQVNASGGKVNLQQAVVIRASAALDLLQETRKGV